MALKLRWMSPTANGRGADAALLATRLVIGTFLVWGVWDNVTSAERMGEFARFLAGHGFPLPALMAPLSAYVQLLVGLGFIAGLANRWAGLLCAVNFSFAVAMVDAKLGIRGAFPATALILLGLIFATVGPGRWSVDRMFRR